MVVYVRDVDESLKLISFCFLSKDLNHDTGFVYAVQQLLTSHMKENFPSIKLMEYFSNTSIKCMDTVVNIKITKIF